MANYVPKNLEENRAATKANLNSNSKSPEELINPYLKDYPALSTLVDLQQRAGTLPTVKYEELPSAITGAYDRKDHSIELQANPWRVDFGNLTPTFAHEFTHSLHRTMENDYNKVKWGHDVYTPEEQKFYDVYGKIAPNSFNFNHPYRDSFIERTGFGMEKYLNPTPKPLESKYVNRPHQDATSASEFYILMDMYNRALKSRGK